MPDPSRESEARAWLQVGVDAGEARKRNAEIEALARELFIRIPLNNLVQGKRGDCDFLFTQAEMFIDYRDTWRERRAEG